MRFVKGRCQTDKPLSFTGGQDPEIIACEVVCPGVHLTPQFRAFVPSPSPLSPYRRGLGGVDKFVGPGEGRRNVLGASRESEPSTGGTEGPRDVICGTSLKEGVCPPKRDLESPVFRWSRSPRWSRPVSSLTLPAEAARVSVRVIPRTLLQSPVPQRYGSRGTDPGKWSHRRHTTDFRAVITEGESGVCQGEVCAN